MADDFLRQATRVLNALGRSAAPPASPLRQDATSAHVATAGSFARSIPLQRRPSAKGGASPQSLSPAQSFRNRGDFSAAALSGSGPASNSASPAVSPRLSSGRTGARVSFSAGSWIRQASGVRYSLSVPPPDGGLTSDELSLLHATDGDLAAELAGMGGKTRKDSVRRISVTGLRRRQLSVNTLSGGDAASPTARELLDSHAHFESNLAMAGTPRRSLWEAVQDEDDALADPSGDLNDLIESMQELLLANPDLLNSEYDPPDRILKMCFRQMLRTNHEVAVKLEKTRQLAGRVTKGFSVKAEVNVDLQDEIAAMKDTVREAEERINAARKETEAVRETVAAMEREREEDLAKRLAQEEEERKFWEARVAEVEAQAAIEREEVRREAQYMAREEQKRSPTDGIEKMAALLKDEIEALNRALDSRDRTILGFKEEVHKLRSEADELRHKLSQAGGSLLEVTELKQELKAKAARAMKDAATIAELQQQNRDLEDRVNMLEVTMERQAREMESKDVEMAARKKSMLRIEDRGPGSRRGTSCGMKELMADNTILRDQIDQLEAEKFKMESELLQLRTSAAQRVSVGVNTDESLLPTREVHVEVSRMTVEQAALSAMAMGSLGAASKQMDLMRRWRALATLRRHLDMKTHQRALSVREEIASKQREMFEEVRQEAEDAARAAQTAAAASAKEIQKLKEEISDLSTLREGQPEMDERTTRMVNREMQRVCDGFRQALVRFGVLFKKRMRLRSLKVVALVDGPKQVRRSPLPPYLLSLRTGIRVLTSLGYLLQVESRLAELRKKLLGTTISRRLELKRMEKGAGNRAMHEDLLRQRREAEQRQLQQVMELRAGLNDKQQQLFENFGAGLDDPDMMMEDLESKLGGLHAATRLELEAVNRERHFFGLQVTRLVAPASPRNLAGRAKGLVPGLCAHLAGIEDLVGRGLQLLDGDSGPTSEARSLPVESSRPVSAVSVPLEVQGDGLGPSSLGVQPAASRSDEHGWFVSSSASHRASFSDSVVGTSVSPQRCLADSVWLQDRADPRPLVRQLTDAERQAQGLRKHWVPRGAGGGGTSAASTAAGGGVKMPGHRPRSSIITCGGPDTGLGSSGSIVLVQRSGGRKQLTSSAGSADAAPTAA